MATAERGRLVLDIWATNLARVLRTAHIALGNNTNFTGGQSWAPIHFDYVLLEPTIELDGKVIMDAGRLTKGA